MIVKNEEAFLDDCLRSVHDIVDEIIIVDTGSTDGTKEIALRYGAKVVDFTWTGDFSAARNFSLDHCSGEWILYLDADERLDQRHVQTLGALIRDKNVSAYNLIIEGDHATETGSLSQSNSYPRLFRKSTGIRFEGRVHEQIWPSLQRMNAVVRQSDVVIHHLGYARGYDVVRQKAMRNLELLRRQALDNPADGYTWFQIGNSCVVLKRFTDAEDPLQKALSLSIDKSVRTSCLNLLAEVELRSGNIEGAIGYLSQSVQLAPKQLMAHWFLALINIDLRKNAEALKSLEIVERNLSIAAAKRASQISADLELRKEDIQHRRAQVMENAGEFLKAAEAYMRLSQIPSFVGTALQGIIRCAEKSPADCLPLLKSITGNIPDSETLALLRSRASMICGDFRAAAELATACLQRKENLPEASIIAIQAYSRLGESDRAEEILQAAIRAGVHEFELYKSGLTLALNRGDIAAAFERLDMMTRTTTADLTPLKQRLQAIAARISNVPA